MKRIRFAAVVVVVALAAFGCGAAEQAPFAGAPTAPVAGPEESTMEPVSAPAATPNESETTETKPAEPEMVRKPIAWAVFRFEPGVLESDREFVRTVVKTVQSYFVIARPKGPPVKVVVKGYWDGCPFNFLAMSGAQSLKVCLKSPGWQDRDDVLNWRSLAHEWFHVVQYNLAERGYLSAGGLNEVPSWLWEGSAEWMAWNALAYFGVASQTYAESTMRWWGTNVSVPLERMVTIQQLVGASPGNADSYGVAYWAVDYLGATPKKLLLLYRRIGEGMDFQEAAKKTFGRAINAKFYRDFEEFRGRGFYE